MEKHKIYARHSAVAPESRLPIPFIKQCVKVALSVEGVNIPCEVSVLITNDAWIRAINNEYRGIDKATDVLSFPMFTFSPPGWQEPGVDAIEPDSGLLPLGEIVLSAEYVRNQAAQLGQPPEREIAYLTAHSVLHLLGFDHLDEADEKKKMREHEKCIMREMGYRA